WTIQYLKANLYNFCLSPLPQKTADVRDRHNEKPVENSVLLTVLFLVLAPFPLSPDLVSLAVNFFDFAKRPPKTSACQVTGIRDRRPFVYDILALRQSRQPSFESFRIESSSTHQISIRNITRRACSGLIQRADNLFWMRSLRNPF